MTDKKNKENDPMFVDKKLQDMEDLQANDELVVADAHDSRVNNLDTISYEDHQQEFGVAPSKEEAAKKMKKAIDNAKPSSDQ